ncbi:hypothetical protein [Deinococcus sonorensis]|uniref:MalT-like TPR region domain-containing protein n=1 Tax=Deinococcus sonorensis TaxID=309891 RepID=A0ABV8YB76_9DEIO
MTVNAKCLPITASEVENPAAYYRWRVQQRTSVQPNELAQALELLGTVAALIRAADLYAVAGREQDSLRCVQQGAASQDPVIRAHALALLARHEAALEFANSAAPVNSAASLPSLQQALLEVRSQGRADPFALEAVVEVLITQAELHTEHRQYQEAMQCASEALLLSKVLDAAPLTLVARLGYATAAHRALHLQEASTHYRLIRESPDVGPRQKQYAALNAAAIQLLYGEDRQALNLLESLHTADPTSPAVQTTWQYARGLCGLLDEEEPICPCPSNNYDQVNQALQLLNRHAGQPDEPALRAVIEALRQWQPNSATLGPVVRWLQGLALLKLGQPLLSAQRIAGQMSEAPAADALLLALQLDISLHPQGADLQPPAALCQAVQGVFDQLSSVDARNGLAARLALWHPVAAAFVAVSPHSVPELADAALPAVFRDGRPIHVYGQGVPARLPFVQLTLSAFGVDASLPRDQHAERDRMREVLCVVPPGGRHPRWRPVVPPAQLVFHLLRVAETEGALWRRTAEELATSHGLVPTTHGASLREERALLHHHLLQLLNQQRTTQGFFAALTPTRRTPYGQLA